MAWPGWRPLPDLAQRAGARPVPVAGLDALAERVGAGHAGGRALEPQRPHGRARRARGRARAVRARGRARVGAARRGVRRLPRAGRGRRRRSSPSCPTCSSSARSPRRTRWRASASATCSRRPPSWPSGSPPRSRVNAPAQAAAAWALELGDPVLARRRAAAARERERLTHALHGTSLSFPPTAAPFVWLSSETHDGAAIAQHLGVRRILVARGRALGRRAARPHHAARRATPPIA